MTIDKFIEKLEVEKVAFMVRKEASIDLTACVNIFITINDPEDKGVIDYGFMQPAESELGDASFVEMNKIPGVDLEQYIENVTFPPVDKKIFYIRMNGYAEPKKELDLTYFNNIIKNQQ